MTKVYCDRKMSMKHFTLKATFIMVVHIFFVEYASAQWIQTNGPWGAEIRSLLVYGDKLFAGVHNGGIYLSSDNGTTWTAVNNGFWFKSARTLARCGNTILAGTIGGGIFTSVDSGSNWVSEAATSQYLRETNTIAVRGNNIFAGSTDYGLLLSIDNGKSWTRKNNGLTCNRILSIAIADSFIFAATEGKGIFLSKDNGNSWSEANNGLSHDTVKALAVNKGNIFAGTDYGIFQSTDNGANWQNVKPYVSVWSLIANDSIVLAGTSLGVMVSRDNGVSWVNPVGTIHGLVYSFAIKDANIFAGDWGEGVFISSDNGLHWTVANKGFTNSTANYLAATGTNIFASISLVGGGLFRSSDRGTTWTETFKDLSRFYAYSLSGNNYCLFAGTNANGIFHSTDYGITWIPYNSNFDKSQVSSILTFDSTIYAGTIGKGIFISANNGLNWSKSLPGRHVYSFTKNGDYVYAGTDSGVFRSKYNDTLWEYKNNGLTTIYTSGVSYIYSLASVSNTIIAGAQQNGLFLSTNNGESWTKANNGLPPYTVPYLTGTSFAVIDGNIFAGTSNGIFLSTNAGTSWSPVNTGLASPYANLYILDLEICDYYIYASLSSSGVWRRPLSEMITVSSSKPSPRPSRQAHFNVLSSGTTYSSATFVFYLPQSEKVNFIVYNISGHEIASLGNKIFAAGLNNITWDIRNVATGFYIARMLAGSNSIIKNFPLIR
jgi:photosystem II stability/assembly factor-like uncharacterized protein